MYNLWCLLTNMCGVYNIHLIYHRRTIHLHHLLYPKLILKYLIDKGTVEVFSKYI